MLFKKIVIICFIASLSACSTVTGFFKRGETQNISNTTTASDDITKPPVIIGVEDEAESSSDAGESVSFDEWRKQRKNTTDE